MRLIVAAIAGLFFKWHSDAYRATPWPVERAAQEGVRYLEALEAALMPHPKEESE
jgi:hypothetical protein